MAKERTAQLAYSDIQALMLDEKSRRQKAAKIAAVVAHFLGSTDLSGLTVLDVGCSGGIVADELSRRGATVVGVDIDVPGIAKARAAYGQRIGFLCADSQALPLASSSVDVVVCNHIYEHVVDPVALFAELRRVVKPRGALYLGLGNRWGVMEPHYRLPFLSWLPRWFADRYVRASGKADSYHEQFTGPQGLRRLCAGLTVWDYTFSVLKEPEAFAANDSVPGPVTRLPVHLLRGLEPLVPTFIWVASVTPSTPSENSRRLRVPPRQVHV